MKKKYLLVKSVILIVLMTLFSTQNLFSQLPNGSTAPDFTLVDLNGTSHNLYDYLDDGYTVFLDFSAIWCGPCWNYHQSHALKNLYENHGPAGLTGVNLNTTDDVMVFFIEGQAGTVAELNGSGSSLGDWVTGTPYPIICTDGSPNSTAVANDYAIGYWPTVYQVCSNRLLTLLNPPASPYSLVTDCLPPPSFDSDARSFMDEGPALSCGDITPEFMLQNYGLTNLTKVTIDVSLNGVLQYTQIYDTTSTWINSPIPPDYGYYAPLDLITLEVERVILPALTGLSQNDLIEIDVNLPNTVVDADPTNNQTISFNVNLGYNNAYWQAPLSIDVALDDPLVSNSTAWFLFDSDGLQVGADFGGPLLGTNTLSLESNECYTLRILGGNGVAYEVTDGRPTGGVVVASGAATSEDFKTNFTTGNMLWTGIEEVSENFNIYPNPANNVLTIDGNYTSVTICDLFGKIVLSTDYRNIINLTDLSNGIYFINIKTNNTITVKKIIIAK